MLISLLWNNTKSYIAFKWDETFSRVPRSRLLTGEISVTEIIFVSFEHNFSAYRENFLFTQSTSQRETYPVSWAHFSIGTKQNYLTWRNVFSLTEITSTHMNRPSNRQGNPEKTLAAQKKINFGNLKRETLNLGSAFSVMKGTTFLRKKQIIIRQCYWILAARTY